MLHALPASVPARIDARTTAAIRLRCDVRKGCTIFTPTGEQIKNVYTTDDTLLITVTSDGTSGPGTVEIVPKNMTEERDGQTVDVEGEVHITVTGAPTFGARGCTMLGEDATKVYRADVTAVDDGRTQSLAYTYPPATLCAPPPPITPAPAPEPITPTDSDNAYNNLDPRAIRWDYRSRGQRPCIVAFALPDRHQVWCRLPDSIQTMPVAYISNGTQPVNTRLVAGHYLVIDDVTGDVTLIWQDGVQTKLTRVQ